MHDEVATMGRPCPNPLWSPWAIVLAGLSLSIGWGIRGNYGHEFGAMFPGALTAIAVCLLSGRQDWRERLPYFACFGALGWAFGGSISYMQVLAYSQSGHAPSQYYGYWGLFLIGYLWAALGAAGTVLPAILDRKSLCELFKPLSLLLALWCLLYFVEDPLTQIIQRNYVSEYGSVGSERRHESLLYWFDSDWLSVLVILIGILVFDLVDRRFSNSLVLPIFAAVGAGAGHLVEWGIVRLGWSGAIRDALVRPQGDPTLFDPKRFVSNWPAIALREGGYVGLAIGLICGIGAYSVVYGKFRRGSALFLHMALGWFIGFLLLPVLLNLRMTPPRGDNWAGILGAYGGVLVYSIRHKLWPLIVASLVCGTIGGIGLSGVGCLQTLLRSLGDPLHAPELASAWSQWQSNGSPSAAFPPHFAAHLQTAENWRFWQQTNWHSLLEQSYGFVNGVGLIVALALLVRRLPAAKNEGSRKRWTEIVAVTLALPVLLYVNLEKNVGNWVNGKIMPGVMRMPLVDFPLSATGWFNVLFGTAALAMVVLLCIHARRRLAILEMSWLGRGQLFYLVLLWAFVIGNFGGEIAGFTERRLVTEGLITFNAILATLGILLVPRTEADPLPETEVHDAEPSRLLATSLLTAILCAALIPPLETVCTRAVYGDAPARAGKHGPETRFGPHATWKMRPVLKGSDHP